MKKIVLVIFALSCLFQAKAQDAIYIYRNDGDFNAFFRDEVDSIVFSNYDVDSIWHNDIISQVVYAQDSIYRIPLVAIDSVSFVQPEIILQPNVVIMTKEGIMDYLQSVDGMSLLFDKSMPQTLQPKAGDVLLCTDFDNSIFNEGFVGKVIQSKNENENILVECDSIYDIFDIFEQLISIEKITEVEEKDKSRRRVEGEWISSRNTRNFNLGFSRDLPGKDNSISLSGSLDGTFIAKVVYCITRKEQYISLWVDHEWQYGAHLKFTHGLGDFGTIFGPVISTPEFRFPAVAPIFKFQIAGTPFAKGEGNMELDCSISSPVHSYVTRKTYKNGVYSGWTHSKNIEGGNAPVFEASGSLDGSIHAGCMVDFWLGLDISIKGIAKASLKLGAGLDFYIGPKADGNFTLKKETDNPFGIYSLFKDSKLSLSFLTTDYEFFGEAALGGIKQMKHVFCNGTIESPLRHEWYLLPEFSDLSILKDESELSATISCEPTRDILFPLSLGIGLFDNNGVLSNFAYQTPNYKHENEGFLINQTFKSLSPNKEYDAKPIIKFLGMNVPASPSETFTLNRELSPAKITNFKVNNASFVRNGFEYKDKICYYDFAATTTVELEDSEGVKDWGYVYKDLDGDTIKISVKDLGTNADSRYDYYRTIPKSTATLYGYAKYGEDNYVYDFPQEYPLEYTFHPKAYVGAVITDSITTTSAHFEYGFDDVPRTGKCYVAVQAEGDDEIKVQSVPYAEKDTVKVSDLLPSTTYTYWAYVEYAGQTFVDPDGKKSFITLTPTAFVEDAIEGSITATSAQFDYGFSNVPDGGMCYLAIQADGADEIGAFSVSATDRDTYTASDLQPATKYSYWAYIEYKGRTYATHDGKKSFVTLAPVATTGECSNVTHNSAMVECTYKDVPEDGTCGVEYTWNGGSMTKSVNIKNGSIAISLSGLKPNTEYTYCAYIEVNDKTFYGEEKKFTTKEEKADLSGTWSCTVYKDDNSVLDTPTLTLTSEGKASIKNSSFTSSDKEGSWSVTAGGKAIIRFSWATNNWVYFEEAYAGDVNSIQSPSLIEGMVSRRWAGNSEHGASYKFIMTK